jgi:hypothetical protein
LNHQAPSRRAVYPGNSLEYLELGQRVGLNSAESGGRFEGQKPRSTQRFGRLLRQRPICFSSRDARYDVVPDLFERRAKRMAIVRRFGHL